MQTCKRDNDQTNQWYCWLNETSQLLAEIFSEKILDIQKLEVNDNKRGIDKYI
jgi:hypothetical protein